jgi:Mg2+ and Co2+ transporter CorA
MRWGTGVQGMNIEVVGMDGWMYGYMYVCIFASK